MCMEFENAPYPKNQILGNREKPDCVQMVFIVSQNLTMHHKIFQGEEGIYCFFDSDLPLRTDCYRKLFWIRQCFETHVLMYFIP